MELRGRWGLVTGAARRIGRSIALALAERGLNVIVHYNASADAAAATVREIEAFGVRGLAIGGDLARGEDVARLAREAEARSGGVDVLVNNASNYLHAPFDELTEAIWDASLDVNLKAPFLLGWHLGRAMRARGRGRIVNRAGWAGERRARQRRAARHARPPPHGAPALRALRPRLGARRAAAPRPLPRRAARPPRPARRAARAPRSARGIALWRRALERLGPRRAGAARGGELELSSRTEPAARRPRRRPLRALPHPRARPGAARRQPFPRRDAGVPGRPRPAGEPGARDAHQGPRPLPSPGKGRRDPPRPRPAARAHALLRAPAGPPALRPVHQVRRAAARLRGGGRARPDEVRARAGRGHAPRLARGPGRAAGTPRGFIRRP